MCIYTLKQKKIHRKANKLKIHESQQKFFQNQLGPKYEGQLILMAEPIPIQNVPLVLPHDAHHFFVTDRRAGTDSSILRGVDTVAHHFHAVCAECRGPRPTSSFGPQRELTPARLVIHRTDLCRHRVVLETLESAFEVRLAYFFPQQH